MLHVFVKPWRRATNILEVFLHLRSTPMAKTYQVYNDTMKKLLETKSEEEAFRVAEECGGQVFDHNDVLLYDFCE